MKIERFEQSGCILTSDSGFSLAIDIAALTPIDKLSSVEVDAMLVSHVNADHCNKEHILTLSPDTLYTGEECLEELGDLSVATKEIMANEVYEIGDFKVQVFEVDHGPNATRVPKQNFGFLITVDKESLYFAGDMYYPSGIDVTNLSVDYALLPVGGHFTFDARAAYDFAQAFKSIGTVYPMHYEAVGPIDTNGAEKFKTLVGNDFQLM